MKSFSIAVVLTTVLTFTHAQTDLLSVLRARNLTVYADFLEQRAPNTLNLLCDRNDLSLYVPVNSAGLPPTPANRTAIRRRDAFSDEAAASMSVSDDSPPIPARRRSPTSPGTAATISDSNFQVRRTFLNDPRFINLGPGVLASIVTNFAESESGVAVMEAMTGFGNKVTLSTVPIKFEGGVFYEIDSWFTLPGFFTSTLAAEGANSYLKAIEKAGLGNRLDTTPGLTVFAPLNSVGYHDDVESYVVYNFLGYTPNLVPGQKYGNITVTKEGAQWYANGAKIVKSDVPIMNGIVHFVDNVPPKHHKPHHQEIDDHNHSQYDSEPTADHSDAFHHHHTESVPYHTESGFNHSGPGHHHTEKDLYYTQPTDYHSKFDHHHTEAAPYHSEPTPYHMGSGSNHSESGHDHDESAIYYSEPTAYHSELDHHHHHHTEWAPHDPEPTAYQTGSEQTYHHSEPAHHNNHSTSMHTHYTRAVSGSAPASTTNSTANATALPTASVQVAALTGAAAAGNLGSKAAGVMGLVAALLLMA